jgi:hypothetical protein
MGAITHGMNANDVEAVGHRLQDRHAEAIRAAVAQIEQLVSNSGSSWTGPDADDFRGWWSEKRQRMLAMAEDLHGFGQSALNNVSEQRGASAAGAGSSHSAGQPGTGGSAGDPTVVGTRTYTISGDASVLVLGAGTDATVLVEELSDGTFRISITSTTDGDLGISTNELLRSLGLGDLPLRLGLGVSTGNGFEVEFLAANAEAAHDLEALLSGRVSDITNRSVLGGGVDQNEINIRHLLADGSVSIESLTMRHQNAGVDGSITAQSDGTGIAGLDVSGTRWNETTWNPATGNVTARTVVDMSVGGGSGWNQDSVGEVWSSEITRDSTGRVVDVVVHREYTTSADVRGGGEKVRDTALGIVGMGNSELTTHTTVTSYRFDPSNGDVSGHIAADDRTALIRSAREGQGNPVTDTQQYTGDSNSATRGLSVWKVGFQSTTEYGSTNAGGRNAGGW